MPIKDRPTANQRLISFIYSLAGRLAAALVFVLFGAILTYRIVTASALGSIIFGLFAVVLVLASLRRDPQSVAIRQAIFGTYLVVSGFGGLGGVHSAPLGIFGVLFLAIALVLFYRISRRVTSAD